MQRGCLGAGIREGTKGTLYALGEQDGLWFRPGSGFMGTREWRCSLQDEPGGYLLLVLMPSTTSGAPGAGGALLCLFLEVPRAPLGSPLQTSVVSAPCAQVFLFHCSFSCSKCCVFGKGKQDPALEPPASAESTARLYQRVKRRGGPVQAVDQRKSCHHT